MTQTPTDELLRKILGETRVIVCVGVSMNSVRPSNFVARYLHLRGYRIIPVNPAYAGDEFFGRPIYDSLDSVPGNVEVDMLDIFRRPEHIPEIAATAMNRFSSSLRTIWMQVGITHGEVAKTAESKGLQVIQNRCPKIEHQRLFGELRKMGFNTGIISSKL